MTVAFNPREVLEIAKQIERNGAAFYRKAAERADDPLVRQSLEDLARMEEEHLRRFTELDEQWARGDVAAAVFDPDDQAGTVLRDWADGHVFNVYDEHGPPVTGKETLDEILVTALGMEKDSVLFYLGLREAARRREDKDLIDQVVIEEMRHVAFLGDAIKHREKGCG